MSVETVSNYLYVAPDLVRAGFFDDHRLEGFSERHKICLPYIPLQEITDLFPELQNNNVKGLVIGLAKGLPERPSLELATRALNQGHAVWFYWPAEDAMECVDIVKVVHFQRHLAFVDCYFTLARIKSRLSRLASITFLRSISPKAFAVSLLKAPIYTIRGFFPRDNSKVNLLQVKWTGQKAKSFEINQDRLSLVTDNSESLYQAMTEPLAVPPCAMFSIKMKGIVKEGAVAVGLLNRSLNVWLNSWQIDEGTLDRQMFSDPQGNTEVTVVITTAGAGRESVLELELFDLTACPAFLREEGGYATSLEAKYANNVYDDILHKLELFIADARPVSFPAQDSIPTEHRTLCGTGVYLRTDYWAKIDSGGSYGHTCYVAKSLQRVTDDFVCFMAHRYTLLDSLGIRQVVLPSPSSTCNEDDILLASEYYFRSLKDRISTIKPAYIYERICLGNYAGSQLSRELGIPYIVEYNGSEISMKRSFDGSGYKYESFYKKAELAAFRQATVISVISEAVKDDVLSRGVDPGKVLVNPNGADIEAYAPLPDEDNKELRKQFDWDDSHVVIGFTGTFGGWHGIDILAEALPEICRNLPEVRWMIIGDGNYRHLVEKAVHENSLQDRVYMAGRVPQKEGARLLGACDIYVSPHNSHMVDSRFFGSPTKIFEYMAMGGAIVASDLEQIGEVLSPALRVSDFRNHNLQVIDERAVLCTPGDCREFVLAVTLLARNPRLIKALGVNARKAVENDYTWDRHIQRLWGFVREQHGIVEACL